MFDITSIGEILVDFHCEISEKINMHGTIGGATCNVAIQSSKLGSNSCIIGAVGNDIIGNFICDGLDALGVNKYIQRTDAVTTMALVSLDSNNDRKFDFLRDPGADSQIIYDDSIINIINNSQILEYGSLAFSKEPSASTILKALQNSSCIKAYDPNLRPTIWNNDELMLLKAPVGLKYANILKIGDAELLQIATYNGYINNNEVNKDNIIKTVANRIKDDFNIDQIFVTMGSKGCYYITNKQEGLVKSFDVNVKDTTGAGDSFFGAILSQYIKNKFSDIEYSVRYACAAGALTASKKGTAEAMPNESEILKLMCEIK